MPAPSSRPFAPPDNGTAGLLVTAFGPFPGVPDNPSARIAGFLRESGRPGVRVEILPTLWGASETVAALAREATRVLMFGVAVGAPRIRYERVAHRAAERRRDAAGALPVRLPARSARSALPVRAMVGAARRAGFDVALSHSPGGYICNATFAAALAANPNSLFVHVPQPAGPRAEALLCAHAQWLTERLVPRRGEVVRGQVVRGW